MNGVLGVVAAYLIGALPIGYVVGRAFGVADIRRHGSGNIGATNVLRTAGRVAAFLTLAGDIAKGYGAVALGAALGGGAEGAGPTAAACAAAAVAGNCWSVFLGFRGGKGVATGLGALLWLVPKAVVPAVAVFVGVAASFRYVSLGSLTATASVPLGAMMLGYPASSVVASLGVAVIVIARHRDNIARLLAGTERRLGERRSA